MSLINYKIMSLINYKIYVLGAQIAGARSLRQLNIYGRFQYFRSSEWSLLRDTVMAP